MASQSDRAAGSVAMHGRETSPCRPVARPTGPEGDQSAPAVFNKYFHTVSVVKNAKTSR